MSERTLAPAESQLDPNPEMDAAIERKIEAAINAGIDLTNLDPASPASAELLSSIGITETEQLYMAGQEFYRIAKVAIGQKIIEALNEHCRVERSDLIPCIEAYFEAVDAGELQAAA